MTGLWECGKTVDKNNNLTTLASPNSTFDHIRVDWFAYLPGEFCGVGDKACFDYKGLLVEMYILLFPSAL